MGAISSAGERLVYTERVGGSNPSSPTRECLGFLALTKTSHPFGGAHGEQIRKSRGNTLRWEKDDVEREGGDSPFYFPESLPEKPLSAIKAAWEAILSKAGLSDICLQDVRFVGPVASAIMMMGEVLTSSPNTYIFVRFLQTCKTRLVSF